MRSMSQTFLLSDKTFIILFFFKFRSIALFSKIVSNCNFTCFCEVQKWIAKNYFSIMYHLEHLTLWNALIQKNSFEKKTDMHRDDTAKELKQGFKKLSQKIYTAVLMRLSKRMTWNLLTLKITQNFCYQHTSLSQ